MIKLDRLELLHWDIQAHQILPLADGVTLCTGENGSGKTSVLDALKVALGAAGNQLGSGRTIDDYLARQAKPVAMIRVVIDNRRAPGTARRPFDPLGAYNADSVTLAVVMRQEEERHYRRLYYVLDGDVVPLVEASGEPPGKARGPRVLSLGDFRKRLRAVGIGDDYRKLLCMPQGSIARFCEWDRAKLFEGLYDIIGGREVLVTWEERLSELNLRVREHEAVKRELTAHEKDLLLLEQQVEQHYAFCRTRDEVAAQRAALPHVALAVAERRVGELDRELLSARGDVADAEGRVTAARAREEGAEQAVAAAAGRRDAARAALQAALASKDAAVRAHADLAAQLKALDRLRDAAQGVPVVDVAGLAGEIERARVRLTEGQVAENQRAARRVEVAAELAQVDKGMLPYPAEVGAFGARLRKAGIAHHVLAEVLEVADEAWTPAVEGYLGRRRFAVLVQDPARWAEAASIARAVRYPHGVLAPDVRGRSPADDEGLTPLVTVGEARYRSLVARLLRRVAHGEPPEPLAPPRGQEHLAQDGFLLTRLEARHAGASRHYLGRRALERRRKQLQAEEAELGAASAVWHGEEKALRAELAALDEAIQAQRRRLAWEAARDEYGRVQVAEAEAGERLETVGAQVAALTAEERDATDASEAAHQARGEAASDVQSAVARRDALRRSAGQLAREHKAAATRLGELLAEAPAAPDDAVRAVLSAGHGVDTLQAMVASAEARIQGFDARVRDPLLPTNFARQRGEADAVGARLERLAAILEETRAAAKDAQDQYQETTRRVFRRYFAKLREAAAALDWTVMGQLTPRPEGRRFACDLRVSIGAKPAVAHDSEALSGGQKAALSILMGMTAVSLERDSAGFFLIDEPFSASDVNKINELGAFLKQTGAQYLLSMPTSADLQRCGDWLQAVWTCTRSRGGHDAAGRPVLAPPVKLSLTQTARRVDADEDGV